MKKKYETDLWVVGIVRQSLLNFITKPNKKDITWVYPEHPYQFIADPFGIWKNDKLYLFVEFLDYRQKKGRIDCIIFDKNLKKLSTQNILKDKSHLSYPFLIEDKNKIYMVPESSKSGKTYIYESVDFPSKWKKVKEVIPNTSMVDASIIKYKNKWWIFYSGANTGLDYDIYLQSIDRFHLNIDTSVRTVLNDFGYNINLNFNTINLSVGKSQEQTFEDIEITNSLTLQPDAIFQAKNIDFTGIPDVSTGLSPGYLYQDNGFIKIVL